MPVLAVTRLRLASGTRLPFFLAAAVPSFAQAKRNPACLAAETRRTSGRVYWTRTLWRDAAAMRAYMRSDAHGKAMPKLAGWCDEAASMHIEWPDETPPDWAESKRLLDIHGHLSRVARPSAAQAEGRILGSAGA
jgi:hypothetical protein